jgi:hypothetical protein
MGPLLLLNFASLSSDSLDQIDQVGWFLPFLALLIPVSILLFFKFAQALFAILVVAQIAGIYFALRAVRMHLRRSGFTNHQFKIMLGPLYLIACFATNIVALLLVGIIHRYL